jgi:hypothetical protein
MKMVSYIHREERMNIHREERMNSGRFMLADWRSWKVK